MKVLIADDDIISRRILESSLKNNGYEVINAADGNEAWEILQKEESPRLAIIDWMMPGLDGIEICKRVRTYIQEPYVYIILLTSKSLKEEIIEGLEAGADDYLTKPFDRHELIVRLRAGKRIVELQEELIRTRENLREMATRDPLTGVWNRGAILEIVNKELSRSTRENIYVGILMCDLDHFKIVNDTHGHIAGDTVLREIAHLMSSSIRIYDAIGRYGGEEFLIVLTGADPEQAVRQAERLRLKVEENTVMWEGNPIQLTLSIGVVSASNQGGQLKSEDLIRLADGALYRAKDAGRNRIEFDARSVK